MSTVSVSGATLLLARSRSIPDIPGIMRSVSRTETGSRRMISSASPPDPAVNTRRDSRSKIFWSESTIGGSSSTTRTVGAFGTAAINSIPGWSSTRMPGLADSRNYMNTLQSSLRQNDHIGQFGAKMTSCRRRGFHPASLSRRRIGGRGDVFRAAGRQRDAEGGPFAEAAQDLDAAAVSIDDAMDDGQAEPRALADVLGREERIEDPGDDLGRDPRSVVRYGDLDILGPRGRGQPNGATAGPLADGLGGVGDKVHEDLIDLARESGDPQRGIDLLVDAHVPQVVSQQIDGVVHAAGQAQLARPLLVAPRVVVQRLHDGLAAGGAALHDAQHLLGVGGRAGRGLAV